MAEEVMIPLSVLLAFALGLAVGVLAMFMVNQQPQVLGGFAGVPRVAIVRDSSGRIVSVEGSG